MTGTLTLAGPSLAIALPLLVLAPLVAIVPLRLLARRGAHAMDVWMAAITAAIFAGCLTLGPVVLDGGRVAVALPSLLGDLVFALDGLGLIVALVGSFVWFAATVHAGAYLHQDGSRLRYHVASLVALSALLGVVVAGDVLTLYVFFEWLGLVCWLFVVHDGGRAAQRAGIKYLALTLLGGLALLSGVLLIHTMGAGPLDVPLPAGADVGARLTAAVLLLLGFGVKAGVLGLHIWLPDAHSSAPAPASALLSGVIVKAGVYGIVRTLGVLMGDAPTLGEVAARQGEALGLSVLWVGVATMLIGVAMALWQDHAKRLLAYSTISQVGFVLVGVGAARYLASEGAVGWTGGLAHLVNHALFKALLFLAMGAVIHAAGTADLRRLGGLVRSMPWTFAFVLVATAGIVGLPASNGYASKSVLHHAIEHAATHGDAPGLALAERLFVLASIGTAAALAKLVAMVFFGRPREARTVPEAPWRMLAAMATLAAAIVALGLRPQLVAEPIEAALTALRMPAGDVTTTLAGPLTSAGDARLAAAALALGVALHLFAARIGAYRLAIPSWLSLDAIVVGTVGGATTVLRRLDRERLPDRSSGAEPDGHMASRAADDQRRPFGDALEQRLEPLPSAVRPSWAAFAVRVGRILASLSHRWDRSARLREPTDGLARSSRAVKRRAGPRLEGDRDRWVRAARREIQRRSRDVGLALGLVILVWAALVLSLIGGRPGP